MLVGDLVHEALDRIGITPERVKGFLGDCCCQERREKLNALDSWARRIVKGKVDNAVLYLNQIIGAKTDDSTL